MKILIYLNGDRGLRIIEKLIECNYKNLIIFLLKVLKNSTLIKIMQTQIYISKNINTKKHYNLVRN